ncbi:MAG: hypothetical protein WCI92_10220 [Bacteroidota bacterium]
MIKKIIFILIGLCLTICAFAQTESFDIATYTIPAGWTKSAKEGSVSYITTDDKKSIFCIITIYASQESKGTALEEFDRNWTTLVATPLNIKELPQTDKVSDDEGREVILGAASFVNGNLAGAAMLSTIVGFGLTTNILTMSNDADYQSVIETFFNGLTIKKVPAAVTVADVTNTGTQSSSKVNSPPCFNTKNGIEGVWMGIYMKAFYGDPLTLGHTIWKTFYGNGQVYEAIPDIGFANFNKPESESGETQFWSSYINNGSGNWIIKRQGVIDIDVKLNERGNMVISSQYYQRCKPVDGLKLNGSWTSWADPDDPELDKGVFGQKALIRFSANGQFTDEGIFNTALEYHKDGTSVTTAGSGTYEIRDYSLILRYNDGHIKQAAFTGFLSLDPAVDDKTICISKVKFSKRSR